MEKQKYILKQALKTIPTVSGCYLYHNEQGTVLYVGKAKNLKKRITSYLYQSHDAKTQELLSLISSINYIGTNNEKEALLLEHTLIKKHLPKYNILLKNKKSYPYIKITKERHPQYHYTTSINDKNAYYYGPFANPTATWTILKLLEQIFPLRKCPLNNNKPCLSYQLGYCSGACFMEVLPQYYQMMIKKVNLFFQGHTKETELLLTKRMNICVHNLQFEAANHLKYLLAQLKSFHSQQTVQFADLLNRDFINYVIADNIISIVTLFYRNGKLQAKDDLIIALNELVTPSDILTRYIINLYEKNTLPHQLYLPRDSNWSLLKALFPHVKCFYPQKGMKAIIFLNAKNNALYALNDWKKSLS